MERELARAHARCGGSEARLHAQIHRHGLVRSHGCGEVQRCGLRKKEVVKVYGTVVHWAMVVAACGGFSVCVQCAKGVMVRSSC